MKTRSLSGIGALIVALLFVGAIFVPAVSATTSENAQDGTADTTTLNQVDRRGDDFLDCYGWLTKETNWIRYGGWAWCSYPAERLNIKVSLRDRATDQDLGYTAYSGANLDYIEAQDNLEVQPPAGSYYTHTRAWSAGPSHDVLHNSPTITWP